MTNYSSSSFVPILNHWLQRVLYDCSYANSVLANSFIAPFSHLFSHFLKQVFLVHKGALDMLIETSLNHVQVSSLSISQDFQSLETKIQMSSEHLNHLIVIENTGSRFIYSMTLNTAYSFNIIYSFSL